MKKLLGPIILGIMLLISTETLSRGPVIYVSPSGSDTNPGTESAPVKTIACAQRMAREIRRLRGSSLVESITIELADGRYYLNEPLLIRSEDGGTTKSPTVFTASGLDHPVISGGIPVTGWKRVSGSVPGLPANAKGKVWVAPIPAVNGRKVEFRQLWINDVKATRASTFNNGPLPRILEVDKEGQSFLIEKPGFTFKPGEPLEFVIHQWWAIAMLRVKEMVPEGKNMRITFHQPESKIEFEHPWPAPFIDEKKELNGNSAYFFVNSASLLDSPGEWYQDLEKGVMYYWPRSDENMSDADVIAPVLETLVEIAGSVDSPVTNVIFDRIGFEHTTWLRPSMAGHVPLQAGLFLLEAYKLKEPGTIDKAGLENQAWTGNPAAAVEGNYAQGLEFTNCTFRHLGATGIDLKKGIKDSKIEGCVFSDIGGTGIQAGYFGGKELEAHMPYLPSDERELSSFLLISNNLVTNVTNEDWGCVGIGIGYAHDVSIIHNEVSHVNYSGISVGWGWTRTVMCMKNNLVHANNIHHFAKMMYDVGGVYTLSAQPNTEISENSIHHLEKAPYAHIPEHYQYIYYDEGSSYIRALNNWTEKDKFFSNTPGPGNEWVNNGPKVDVKIKENAGLQADYRHLLIEYEREDFPYKAEK